MTHFQKNFSRREKQGSLRLKNVGSCSMSVAHFYGKATKLHCLKIVKYNVGIITGGNFVILGHALLTSNSL